MKGSLISFIISILLLAAVQPRLALGRATDADLDQTREVLYLPNGDALRLLSLGYENALANLLWFNTINYFGKHYARSRDYRWLDHMCTLVLDLNPRASEVYEFCASMLAWEAGQPRQAVDILSRAILHLPQEWFFRYLRGFFQLHFLNDAERATVDFVEAAKLPNCHPVVQRLAARGLAIHDPSTAIEFLALSLERAQDPKERSALKERLAEAIFERDVRLIESIARTVPDTVNIENLGDLQAYATAPLPTNDPWGYPYRLTKERTVITPAGRRRLTDFHRRGGASVHGE